MQPSLTKDLFSEGLFAFCGPCVIESEDSALFHAEKLAKIFNQTSIKLIYKSSFDKANRTSLSSFRGPGLDDGLKVLQKIKNQLGLPVVTDIHETGQVSAVAEVADVLQVPAFLCRQTDLLVACAKSGKGVMVKKGQFMAPEDMKYVAEKLKQSNQTCPVLLCERGSSFGYRHLVVDFAGLETMKTLGYPVVFDATHSVQIIGGAGGVSSGRREAVASLARASVAVGVNGLFIEAHQEPASALSDGANMLSLEELAPLLADLDRLHELQLETRR